MSLFTKDDSQAKINELVSEVKSSVTLDAESQTVEYSGHESAEYGKASQAGANQQVGE